jgi:hypothetical protein
MASHAKWDSEFLILSEHFPRARDDVMRFNPVFLQCSIKRMNVGFAVNSSAN